MVSSVAALPVLKVCYGEQCGCPVCPQGELW